MPAFSATYSAAARETLLRLHLADGVPVRAIQRQAKAGELPVPEPIAAELAAMSYTHACELMRRARDHRDGIARARAHPRTSARQAVIVLLRRAERDAQRIAGQGPKSLMDAGQAARTLRVIRESLDLLEALDKGAGKGSGKAGDTVAAEPPTLAARIARAQSTARDDAPGDGDAPAAA